MVTGIDRLAAAAIDPTHTSLEATRFILVLYLFQAKIIDLSIDEPAWGFVRDFANLNRQRPFDDAVLWEAVAAMVNAAAGSADKIRPISSSEYACVGAPSGVCGMVA